MHEFRIMRECAMRRALAVERKVVLAGLVKVRADIPSGSKPLRKVSAYVLVESRLLPIGGSGRVHPLLLEVGGSALISSLVSFLRSRAPPFRVRPQGGG